MPVENKKFMLYELENRQDVDVQSIVRLQNKLPQRISLVSTVYKLDDRKASQRGLTYFAVIL